MSKRILNRREFLASAAKVTASVVVVAGTTTILAANAAWSMELSAIDERGANLLLAMTRRLYPHDMLGDIYYAEVVEALDAKAKADPDLARLLKDGPAELDAVYGVPFLRLSPGMQTTALTKIAGGKFFAAVRGHTVVALYNNKNVWPNFGYQGSSAEWGGYLFRGFQDAGWTMQPDAEASPPAYVG